MSSFKSFIKHPVIAGTLSLLIGTLTLKLTGYLPTVWSWLKISLSAVVGLLTTEIPVWSVIAIGLIIWLLIENKNKSQTTKFTESEMRILELFVETDDARFEFGQIVHSTKETKLITQRSLDSLDEKGLIDLNAILQYYLTREGRKVVANTILKDL